MPAAFLESKIGSTAELLERAYDHGAWIVAFDVPDREVLTSCSAGRRFYRSVSGSSARG